MHGLDIRNFSIEALAALRDDTNKLLGEKVAAKQKELQGELERFGALVEGKVLAKAPPKYRKGSETWSGRGSRPAFIQAHLDGGGSLEDLRV
jgi:DNA-binding protein H-NS